MKPNELKNLAADQKACLGRVYRFIIERGRQNQAKAAERETCRKRTLPKDNQVAVANTKYGPHLTNFS